MEFKVKKIIETPDGVTHAAAMRQRDHDHHNGRTDGNRPDDPKPPAYDQVETEAVRLSPMPPSSRKAPPMTDPDQAYPPGVVHIARSNVDEGILDHQVQNCPKCETELEQGFGMAGGGYGAYGYCTVCDRVRWRVASDD